MQPLCLAVAFAAPASFPLQSRVSCSTSRAISTRPLIASQRTRRRRRTLLTACAEGGSGDTAPTSDSTAPASDGAATTSGDAASATARMAALLGRDVDGDAARQREEADALAAQNKRERRRNVGLAILSAFVGAFFSVIDYRNPDAPIMLMERMERSSAPITAIGNGKPTLVDVGATWCKNCKTAAPNLYRLTTSPRFSQKVNFIVVDADDPASADIVDRFQVDGIPHQVVLDGKGKIMATLVGQVPIDAVEDDLQALLSGENTVPYVGASYNDVRGFDGENGDDY